MRNYIILNGTNSNTINGLLIQSLAPISKPLMRTETEEIDGRDGDISTPLGFSAYDKEITVGLYGNYDINAIIAFFNSEGTVTFSNEPDKYYNYQIFQQIDFERLVRFRTATVTFHIQPFKYGTTGESQTLSGGDSVSDEGTNLVLEGSALAPFSQFDLKGNTVQDGTPTPDAPVPVQVVTGENTVKIHGKNMFNADNSIGEQTQAGVTASMAGSVISLDGEGTGADGSTSGMNRTWTLSNPIMLAAGTYSLSGTVLSGSWTTAAQSRLRSVRINLASGTYKEINAVNGSTTIQGSSFTLAEATSVVSVQIMVYGQVKFYDLELGLQLELGSTATTYEPYQEQSYEINLGKNLTSISSGNNVVLATLPAGTYTFSMDYDYSVGYSLKVGSNSGATIITRYPDGSGRDAATFTISGTTQIFINGYSRTTGETYVDGTRNYQLELGSTATSYAPYFTPIELCKIGTYQDYIWKDGDTWKVHKACDKVVFNGVEGWSKSGSRFVSPSLASSIKPTTSNSEVAEIFSDKFNGITINNTTQATPIDGIAIASSGNIVIYYGAMKDNTYQEFKTWLGTNNVIMYYQLATPTDTAITNSALIEQLDAIANQAHAYRPRTHISSTYADGNVPHIIAATVVGDASGTITNAGNIYSKPKLTVYGSGDIGIYLNGVQMLQIALGSDGYITIDTNLMEAYKGNLQTLKNRQVTGDYSNFKLPVGQSTISFSGVVTSCVVENYSRWL